MIWRPRSLLYTAVVVSLLTGCTAAPSTTPQAARRIASSASPSGAANACRWAPVPPGNAAIKDVGTPPASIPAAAKATMTMTTNLGLVEITMDAKAAPCAVASFAYLAGRKFFDGSSCHRLVTAKLFVLQCGDPSGTGMGGPAYQYAEENLEAGRFGYSRGSVAVARSDTSGTSGSQFFINYADNPRLPANYTPLGTITKGTDIIDKVAAGGVASGTNDPDDGVPKIGIVLQQVTVAYG
ncbi:peptidylprolyl isomerase [Dactylosporangium sp. NPDC000555]|uniref:peptidylprolyl isomerase n=1 Tax=Dactylosporangium sp. NPDC000555 TaxID=3154260 RepID=UPI003323B201